MTDNFLEIQVKDLRGEVTHFRVRPTTAFGKIKRGFCNNVGIDPNTIRLLFDGQRILDDQTPADLDMESGDIVEAYLEQVGGGESRASTLNTLRIEIEDVHGNATCLHVGLATKFSEVKAAYCAHKGFDPASICLRFDGYEMADDQTSADLELENGDLIRAEVISDGDSTRLLLEGMHIADLQTPPDLQVENGYAATTNGKQIGGGQTTHPATVQSVDIIIKGIGRNAVRCRVLPITKFSDVKTVFCRISNWNPSLTHLLFNRVHITDDQTPADLGIQSGNLVEAWPEQVAKGWIIV